MERRRKLGVALISKDWQLRTLVRAQLQEEGFEAIGLDSLPDAIELLTWSQIRADVILLDPGDQELDTATVRELRNLTRNAPIVALLRRTVSSGDVVSIIQPEAILYRPFSVHKVVEAVQRLTSNLPGDGT